MKVFIGCSANEEVQEKYLEDCRILLDKVLSKNDLAFGVCGVGLMGEAYQAAKKYHRQIIGICPEFYTYEFERVTCDEEVVTETMLDSTLQIYKKSDAILILPGGFGSVYELFTAIQSSICDEIHIPIILYNSCGYYDKLIDFINSAIETGFARSLDDMDFFIANTTEEVLSILEEKNIK